LKGGRLGVIAFRNEVGSDMGKGLPVIFVVDNAGQSARGIIVKLDNEEIAFAREVAFSGLYVWARCPK
jgi:hypothetical protein